MQRRPGALLVNGAARRLAVDGDHLGRLAGDGGNPGDEALLEGLGIQGGENGAELIVRGRAVGKRSETAQQLPFLLAEAGNIDDGLRPRQHREQAQKQDLVQGVDHLAGLPRVRHRRDMVKKSDGFLECTRFLHGDLPCRIGRPPSLHNSPALSRSLSPDCPGRITRFRLARRVLSDGMMGQLRADHEQKHSRHEPIPFLLPHAR